MTEVFRKLNYKDQETIVVLNAPAGFENELKGLAGKVDIHRSPRAGKRYGFLIAFTPMKTDLLAAARKLVTLLEEGAVLWFAYPKQTSKKYSSDLNRDTCWEALKPLKLQPVRQIAIDDDWSALRFKPAP